MGNPPVESTIEETKIKAAIYARTSSPNQKYNYSIEEQIACCRNYAIQKGWLVKYLFFDESERGENTNRPKLQLMLQKAKLRYFDVIIFWRIDRFARSLEDLVRMERILREYNIGLCSTMELIDTSTSVGRFNFRSIGSVAELEAELIGERARMGLHALAKLHKWPNPHPPLGYQRLHDGRLKIKKKEARVVRKIFHIYIDTKSMSHVAFLLNDQGLFTKRGKKWTAISVQAILSDDIYIGIYDVAGVREYDADYRIIEDETFLKARLTRTRNREKGNKKPAVPLNRKIDKINRIFENYASLLEEAKTCQPL